MFQRMLSTVVCLAVLFGNIQPIAAQEFTVIMLPIPGAMVGVSVPFTPLSLKGLIVNPKDPLEFQFIMDTGKQKFSKEAANQLVKYFLTGLTIPEEDLWVNLSPYEHNRIVPSALGETDLGRDLLAQDYILKQLTASLIYPEKDLGKQFWAKVYQKAQEKFGTTDIPVNTFNKVWILPNQAQVFEHNNSVYVTKSTLKVLLDDDYLAPQKNQRATKRNNCIATQIIRDFVLPEIEKEVNQGKNFAPLRQIFQALILAKWYKETVKNGLLDALYTNKSKTAGIDLKDPLVKERIYKRYVEAYKKGVFNYIKEPVSNCQLAPRKYFSGGTKFSGYSIGRNNNADGVKANKAMVTKVRLLIAKIRYFTQIKNPLLDDAWNVLSSSYSETKRRMERIDWLKMNNVGKINKVLDELKEIKTIKDTLTLERMQRLIKIVGEFRSSRFFEIISPIEEKQILDKLGILFHHYNPEFENFSRPAWYQWMDKKPQIYPSLNFSRQDISKPSRRMFFIFVSAAIGVGVASTLLVKAANLSDDEANKILASKDKDKIKRLVRGKSLNDLTRILQNSDTISAQGLQVILEELALVEGDLIPRALNVLNIEISTRSNLNVEESEILWIKLNQVRNILNRNYFHYQDQLARFDPKVSSNKAMAIDGGIDLKHIHVHRNANVVKVQFDPAELDEFVRDDFQGFKALITKVTAIQSPLSFMGF